MRSIWDKVAAYQKEAPPPEYNPVRSHVLLPAMTKLLGNLRGKSVVDVGCGDGKLLPYIQAAEPDLLVAVDSSWHMLSLCPPGTVRVLADVEDGFPWKEAFDVAVAVMVIHALPRAESALKNIARGLKPNGKLILALPHPCFHIDEAQIGAMKRHVQWNVVGPWRPRSSYGICHENANIFGTPPISVPMYHRPIECYVKMLAGAGFVLSELLEPCMPSDVEPASLWTVVPPILLLEGRRTDRILGKDEDDAYLPR